MTALSELQRMARPLAIVPKGQEVPDLRYGRGEIAGVTDKLPVFRGGGMAMWVPEKVVQIQCEQANSRPIKAIAPDLRLSRTWCTR